VDHRHSYVKDVQGKFYTFCTIFEKDIEKRCREISRGGSFWLARKIGGAS